MTDTRADIALVWLTGSTDPLPAGDGRGAGARGRGGGPPGTQAAEALAIPPIEGLGVVKHQG
jgi:hypothetical protein